VRKWADMTRTVLLALIALLVVAACPAAAQVNVQLSGTVDSIDSPTLVLRTNPPPPRRVTFGETANPAPPLPPTIVVDLDGVPVSQYFFLRPGDRIAIVGLPSSDGRRFTAIRIIGEGGRRRDPEAP
jgi:hypothetical protein